MILPKELARQFTPVLACSGATQEQLLSVISLPILLRNLFVAQQQLLISILNVIYRARLTFLIEVKGYSNAARTGRHLSGKQPSFKKKEASTGCRYVNTTILGRLLILVFISIA